MNQLLTIGKLAKTADVSIDSIRFYEGRGLLDQPLRTDANYRLYPPEAVKRLRFVKKAQRLGFSLDEIRDLLDLSRNPEASKADVKKKTEEKIADIRTRMRDLDRMLQALEQLDARCDGHGAIGECPILQALSDDDSPACHP